MDDPVDSLVNNKPRVGLTFTSENEAYDFYNNYGRLVGFSIRKDYAHRMKEDNTIITQRRFVCSKEGIRSKDKRDIRRSKPRAETRTGCPAKMGISRLTSGLYECRYFVEEHNHELHTPATTHFMRSQRSTSNVHAIAIDLGDDSEIMPKVDIENMGMQAEERENLWYTRQDLKNYLRTKRVRDLSFGEAGSILNYFENQIRLNPSFIYSLQFDSSEKITNIFWADPRMIIDYAMFGEVVSFDTRFCRNKEVRPLSVFAGVNHHRGVTIFGAALLYDETVESFKWLFRTFLEAHGQKKPLTIVTDQDLAISEAIAEVLVDTRHGLCTWHLIQNGIKHLGNLMKDGSRFLQDFNKCMYEYEDEDVFEQAWKKLLEDHPIENNTWLDQTYILKKKWARCYMKNAFTLGIRSTQISESFNSGLKDHLRNTLDIVQFFKHFERVLNDMRANELKAEFLAKEKQPQFMGLRGPVLKKAAKLYTPYAFEQFMEEYKWIGALSIKTREDYDGKSQYIVGIVDDEGDFEEAEFTVLYEPSECLIECSCRKFETFGILCCHALKILDALEIKCIPERYILKRWTRGAKSLVVEDSKGKEVVEDANLNYTQRFSFICPKYVRILTQACNSVEGFQLVRTVAEELSQKLDSLAEGFPIGQDCYDTFKRKHY